MRMEFISGTALVPWTRTLSQLAACFFITGASAGFTNAGVNTLIVHLWRDASGPPLYLLHFGFGLGAFLAPLVARPFLVTTPQNSSDANAPLSNETTQLQQLEDESTSNTFVPYSCVAVVYTFFTLAMLGYYVLGPPRNFPKYTPDTRLKRVFSPRNWSPSHPCLASLVLALMFTVFTQGVGAELVFGNFIFSFATDADVAFSKDAAAMLTSLFWLSHMIGRLLGAGLALCVPTSVVLLADVILLTVVSLLLVLFGHSHSVALWTLAAAYGLFISPIVPAGNHWTSLQIAVNPMSTTILFLGSSTGLLAYVYVAGRLMENFGPESVMKFLLFCGVGLVVSVLCALLVAGKHRRATAEEVDATRAERTKMMMVEVRSEKLELESNKNE